MIVIGMGDGLRRRRGSLVVSPRIVMYPRRTALSFKEGRVGVGVGGRAEGRGSERRTWQRQRL